MGIEFPCLTFQTGYMMSIPEQDTKNDKKTTRKLYRKIEQSWQPYGSDDRIHDSDRMGYVGKITVDHASCNQSGIDAFFPILRGVTTLEDAMKPENAKANMADTVEQVFRLLNIRRK